MDYHIRLIANGIGAAVARFSTAIMYIQILFSNPVHKEYFVATIMSLFGSSCMFAATAGHPDLLFHNHYYLGLFVVALFVENPLVNIYYMLRR